MNTVTVNQVAEALYVVDQCAGRVGDYGPLFGNKGAAKVIPELTELRRRYRKAATILTGGGQARDFFSRGLVLLTYQALSAAYSERSEAALKRLVAKQMELEDGIS